MLECSNESWSILSSKTYGAFFHYHVNGVKALFVAWSITAVFLFVSQLVTLNAGFGS